MEYPPLERYELGRRILGLNLQDKIDSEIIHLRILCVPAKKTAQMLKCSLDYVRNEYLKLENLCTEKGITLPKRREDLN